MRCCAVRCPSALILLCMAPAMSGSACVMSSLEHTIRWCYASRASEHPNPAGVDWAKVEQYIAIQGGYAAFKDPALEHHWRWYDPREWHRMLPKDFLGCALSTACLIFWSNELARLAGSQRPCGSRLLASLPSSSKLTAANTGLVAGGCAAATRVPRSSVSCRTAA